jgi:hypothetical protein
MLEDIDDPVALGVGQRDRLGYFGLRTMEVRRLFWQSGDRTKRPMLEEGGDEKLRGRQPVVTAASPVTWLAF